MARAVVLSSEPARVASADFFVSMSLSDLQQVDQQCAALVAAQAPVRFVGGHARGSVAAADDAHAQEMVAVHREFTDAPAGSLCHDPEARRLLRDLLAHSRAVDQALRDPHADAPRQAVAAFQRAVERAALGLLKLAASGCGADADPRRLSAFLNSAVTGVVLADTRRRLGLSDAAGMPGGEAHIGRAVYAAFGQRPPWFGSERAGVAALATPAAPVRDGALSPMLAWGLSFQAATAYSLNMHRLIAAVAEIEAKLPPHLANATPERLQSRVEAYAWLPSSLAEVEAAERAYAATLGRQGRPAVVHRAPIEDVAALAAFHRVQNHADPFQMYEEAMAATGGAGAAKVGRSIEVALARRFTDVFTTETRSASGEIVHRPLGWGLDPRLHTALVAAHAAGQTRSFLEQLATQLDDRDAEFSRADVVATKLADLDLLAEGIAGIRPIATGETTEVPRWSLRAEEHLVYAFQEGGAGEAPVLDGDQEIVGWHILVDRHPHNQTRAPAAGTARRVTAEPSWIPTTLAEAAAFAPLGPPTPTP